MTQGLEADQIVLITNKNTPQGLMLAELYAQVRKIPDHRILELNLPTSEEMAADTYDREVVPAIRAFLRDNELEHKITCLVTFYGVPIRIGSHKNSPKDEEELAGLKAEQVALPARIEPLVAAVEKLAMDGEATFKPLAGMTFDDQSKRGDAAMRRLILRASKGEPAERNRLQNQSMEVLAPLLGRMGMMERHLLELSPAAIQTISFPTTRPTTTRPTTQPTNPAIEAFLQFRTKFTMLRERKFDSESRRQLRDLMQNYLGPFEYGRLLQSQIAYFQTENTVAAFDSELALLWWDYSKTAWMANPLHYSFGTLKILPVLMVSRLDGPQVGVVKQIIETSMKVEAEGLKGRIVVDSRGMPPEKNGKPEPYGEYDQTVRNFAELVRTKTKLSSVFDDRPEVLAAGSVKNVAVYVGWYSVDKYIAACEFNPGAVAFHLASFTMTTLKHEDPRGWVRGLLKDGAVATFGPVAEPYLQSFPRADDFFPLLLTGKLTLAEVYWKTTPMTSWMNSLIGDPLYTPYKTNPALAVEDLPPRLQVIFKR